MADTLKFGPEWLRALSDGNSVVTPPPSPAVPFGKYKLADYRYGREEMLALFNPNSEVPEDLQAVSSILVEKAQVPVCLLPLSEEEQRIMSQSVNSVAVLRMMGRGAPPLRGGRGISMERGRGRGRGRGEGYIQRGSMSYDESDTGGFGRGRSLSRPDGWEEAGAKRFERTFQNRYDDTGSSQKVFQRSLSNDNWRVREDEDDEDDGDWRRAGSSKWSSRGSWRDRGRDGGFEFDRSGQSNLNRNQGGFSRQYQRSRSSESWDDEDLPEWIVPDHGDGEELGTFDASGAFVSNKKKEQAGTSAEVVEEGSAAPPPDEPVSLKKEQKPEKTSGKNQVESSSKDTKDIKPEKSNANHGPNKTVSPRPSDSRENSNSKSNSSQSNNKSMLKSSASEKDTSKISSKEETLHAHTEKNISNSTYASDLVTEKTPNRNLSPSDLNSKKAEDIKLKSEADALKKLKETAENMVADMTVEDEKEKALLNTDPCRVALPTDHENSLKWLYRDPQGDLQGPFTASEMAEWFSAGYFTMNLLVKRGIDEKFSPLGELIKRWGRVPFLPGSTPPPLLNSPQLSPEISQQQQQRERERELEEQALQVLQQHVMLQQQIMQQQLIRQTLTQPWLHLQQIQGLIQQLQENEQFKSLPPLQQQQIAIQMLMKQPPPLLLPTQQQPHSLQQKLSPRTPPSEAAAAAGVLHPSFHRSLSNPGETTSHSHTEEATMKGLSQPTSIWDIDAKSQLQPNELEAHLKKLQREQEEAERRKKIQEEERKRQAEIERKHQELKKEQEEIQRQKEAMEKELQELERKKQMELQRIEEEKKKAEERIRIEEERRKQEELRRKEEEDRKRRQEEERRQREEVERRQQKQQQELKRQQELKLQEIQRQQELRRQKEQEELEKQKQAEIQHRQELRQQEAMRKLQQEQLTNMQLPAHAQWASCPPSINSGLPQKTIAEIEQEERERQDIEEKKKRKEMEMQRQQSLLYQQQQQQQQKSWSTPVKAPVVASTRSLLEIQEEQARQFEVEKTNRDQQQQQVTKNMSISSASVWSGVAPSNWASEGAWGNALRASKGESDNGNSLGFWDEAIISSSGPLPKKQSGNKNSSSKGSADFPALGAVSGQNRNVSTIKSKPVKSNKDEEAAQRLFQALKPADDFTRWCENTLRNMATSVDIPTFIGFLQEVESPYEVYDYVKSYLGDTKAAHDFAKQFLEKRSQYKNKSKPVTQEDSIWGPAPAVNPHEHRQQHASNTAADNNDEQKGKGKKKKKMTKIDNSILGFTVHAAPDRFNVGELDTIDGK
ncbi:hypothetical protein CHS0354_022810 [Potamilus streckersoni]|uniref:GYF domain-containing protein n=1 Tax=Potamilus streckersoni TaxID=2493646 RepID=A0AAE0S295_9BIVA|nr:hypothetical protein CHS0354_022810 [Potamilus streckersoni]